MSIILLYEEAISKGFVKDYRVLHNYIPIYVCILELNFKLY